MAKRITLGEHRPQEGDIYLVLVNQQPSGENKMEVEVKRVVVSPQQLHVVCEVGGQEKEVSLGQGTQVVENLW